MESVKQGDILEKQENIINTSSKKDDCIEKQENITNTIAKSEISTTTTEKPKMVRKKLVHDYASRGLDICGVCKKKYNLGDRIPRILVHCGHTFCTSCLIKFHHVDHIRWCESPEQKSQSTAPPESSRDEQTSAQPKTFHF